LNTLLLVILSQNSNTNTLKAEAEIVINKGNNLFNAKIPPKIKLSSVSKKLVFGKMFTLCCQTSVPTPTNKSLPK